MGLLCESHNKGHSMACPTGEVPQPLPRFGRRAETLRFSMVNRSLSEDHIKLLCPALRVSSLTSRPYHLSSQSNWRVATAINGQGRSAQPPSVGTTSTLLTRPKRKSSHTTYSSTAYTREKLHQLPRWRQQIVSLGVTTDEVGERVGLRK